MAHEPFLINPPKRLRKRKSNPSNPWFGESSGHRIASLMRWGSRKRGRIPLKFRDKRRKIVYSRMRRRSNPIGETLVTIGANPMRRNPWFGHSAGHRRAALIRWGKRKRVTHRRRSSSRRRVVHRATRRSLDKRTRAYRSYRASQQREAAAYLGMFTGKRRKYKYVRGRGYVRFRKNPFMIGGSHMARRRHRRNTWFGQPRRHRRAALKGWRRGHKIGSRRVKHYRRNPEVAGAYHANPRRRKGRRYDNVRRRHRRNPAYGDVMKSFTGKGGLTDVASWGPLALTGSVSAITTTIAPGMLGLVNPWAQLGTKLVVAFGGGAVVEKAVGRQHGQVWMLVGVSLVAFQLLKQYVLMPYAPQFAVSLGAYQDYYGPSEEMVSQQVGAFPHELSAYPQEMSAYPGVGAEEEEVGAYPYDGRYGY